MFCLVDLCWYRSVMLLAWRGVGLVGDLLGGRLFLGEAIAFLFS